MDIKILISLLSPLVAFIVPFLLWYLNKREKNIFQQQIEKQIARFNLLDKMISLSEKSKLDISFDEDIQYEIGQSREILNMDEDGYKEKENTKRRRYLSSISTLRKTFLLYRPSGIQFFVFQLAFFYICFSFISGTLSFLSGYGEIYQEFYSIMNTDESSKMMLPYLAHIINTVFTIFFIVQITFAYFFYRGANKYQFK